MGKQRTLSTIGAGVEQETRDKTRAEFGRKWDRQFEVGVDWASPGGDEMVCTSTEPGSEGEPLTFERVEQTVYDCRKSDGLRIDLTPLSKEDWAELNRKMAQAVKKVSDDMIRDMMSGISLAIPSLRVAYNEAMRGSYRTAATCMPSRNLTLEHLTGRMTPTQLDNLGIRSGDEAD